MKLIIDSTPVNIPLEPNISFRDYTKKIMDWLLSQDRSISSCKINGVPVHTLDEANHAFHSAEMIEVDSVPLKTALLSAMAIQSAQLRRLEEHCENLVTDCLLSEPEEVADHWSTVCNTIKEHLGFLPQLSHFLSEEQINQLVEIHCKELNDIMTEASEVFPKADLVSFSDVIELRLLPWIRNMREFTQNIVKSIDSLEA